MKHSIPMLLLFVLLGATSAMACEYKEGETQFLDYAHCVYGEDEVLAVALPEDSSWEFCVYRIQAFMPAKLLAITRVENGKEKASINCRGAIGNPCYLMKSRCDAALDAQLN